MADRQKPISDSSSKPQKNIFKEKSIFFFFFDASKLDKFPSFMPIPQIKD